MKTLIFQNLFMVMLVSLFLGVTTSCIDDKDDDFDSKGQGSYSRYYHPGSNKKSHYNWENELESEYENKFETYTSPKQYSYGLLSEICDFDWGRSSCQIK